MIRIWLTYNYLVMIKYTSQLHHMHGMSWCMYGICTSILGCTYAIHPMHDTTITCIPSDCVFQSHYLYAWPDCNVVITVGNCLVQKIIITGFTQHSNRLRLLYLLYKLTIKHVSSLFSQSGLWHWCIVNSIAWSDRSTLVSMDIHH